MSNELVLKVPPISSQIKYILMGYQKMIVTWHFLSPPPISLRYNNRSLGPYVQYQMVEGQGQYLRIVSMTSCRWWGLISRLYRLCFTMSHDKSPACVLSIHVHNSIMTREVFQWQFILVGKTCTLLFTCDNDNRDFKV